MTSHSLPTLAYSCDTTYQPRVTSRAAPFKLTPHTQATQGDDPDLFPSVLTHHATSTRPNDPVLVPSTQTPHARSPRDDDPACMGVSFHVSGPEQYGFPHAAGPELDRLAKGPAGPTVLAMEAALAAGYVATEVRVHVITGFLKASGHPSSSFDGERWEGEIDFARYPGIFELARGNMPTMNHPEGGHYFFDPGGPEFEAGVRQAVWDFVTGGAAGHAPSGDLGPWSGG